MARTLESSYAIHIMLSNRPVHKRNNTSELMGYRNGGVITKVHTLECRVPNTAPIYRRRRSCVLCDSIWREFLRQDGKLRAVFVHPNVRAAHATLTIKGRAPVEYTMIVHNWVTQLARSRGINSRYLGMTYPLQSLGRAAPSIPSPCLSIACTTYGSRHTYVGRMGSARFIGYDLG